MRPVFDISEDEEIMAHIQELTGEIDLQKDGKPHGVILPWKNYQQLLKELEYYEEVV